jgi:membrane protein DedA with SNARE-associated domain
MNLQEILLNALATYGVMAIFVSVFISSVGLPLPTSFLLIVAGSFIEAGELQFWPIVIASTIAAVLGDHTGYGVGWFGGKQVATQISQRLNAEAILSKAEQTAQRWGGVSVFFSRWLITALGPYINLISGITRYTLPRFSVWVVLGELLWVLAYIYLGRLFSDRVAELSELLGDLSYVVLGLVAVVILGYQVIKSLREPKTN